MIIANQGVKLTSQFLVYHDTYIMSIDMSYFSVVQTFGIGEIKLILRLFLYKTSSGDK